MGRYESLSGQSHCTAEAAVATDSCSAYVATTLLALVCPVVRQVPTTTQHFAVDVLCCRAEVNSMLQQYRLCV